MKKIFAITSVLLVLVSLLLLSGVTVPLGFLNKQLESVISDLLDRKVEIHEPIRITTSLHPELILGNISISNPSGWREDSNLVDIKSGRGQISILPLFGGDIQIDELIFEGVDIQLVARVDSTTNYQFAFLDEDTADDTSSYALNGIGNVQLRDIRLEYQDELSGKKYSLTIDEALGNGMPETPLHLSAQGNLLGKAYSLELSGDSLRDLVQGTKAWPITKGQLNVASAVLDVSGTLDRSEQAMAATLAVSFRGDDLNEVGEMFGFPLPETGSFSVRSEVNLLPDTVHVGGLDIIALDSSVQGDLSYFFGDGRPKLKGELTIPELDSTLFTAFQETGTEISTPPATIHVDDVPPLPWGMLKMLDVDLDLHVGLLPLGTIQMQEMQAAMTLSGGDLVLPFSFSIDNVPANGKLVVQTSGEVPMIELSFTSKTMPAAPLLKLVTGDEQFGGQTGAVVLDGKAWGQTLQQLIEGLNLNMQIAGTRLHTDAGLVFTATTFSLERKAGNPLALAGQGEFLGRPFEMTTRTGRSDASQDAAPFSLDLNACDTKLKFDAVTHPHRQDALIDFNFSVSGQHLCGLLSPVESFMGNATDVSVSGTGKLSASGGSLNIEEARLGTIAVDATAELQLDARGKPLITANVHSKHLDLSPFLHGHETSPGPAAGNLSQEPLSSSKGDQTAGGDQELSSEQKAEVLKTILTQDIFPHTHLLTSDAMLEIHLEELDTGQGGASNIRLKAEIKDGALAHAPFRVTVADELFTGDAQMDLTGETPIIHFEMKSKDFHLPALFHEFQMENPPNLTADHISLLLEFEGKTIPELLGRSSQELAINGGKWQLDREVGEPIHIDIDQARYRSTPNVPATITLAGYIDTEPLSIELTEDGLFGRKTNKPLTLEMRARLADTELRIDGKLIRKVKSVDGSLNLHTALSGSRMNKLNELLGVDLPPLGPYLVEGSLKLTEKAITFHDMLLQIGDSVLKGEMALSTPRKDDGKLDFPLTLTTRLNAETIQLNDFRLGSWSAISNEQELTSIPDEEAPEQDPDEKKNKNQLNDLISPEVAGKLNASLEVKVQEVLSGRDQLGSGLLKAKIDNGIYSLDTLHLDIPGGAVIMNGSIHPEQDKIQAQLGLQIDHLDYGVIARRALPDSDLKGEVNLNLELRSEADTPMAIKEHLNGYLQFGVVPEEFKAGIIDLWAVNILASALPVLMKGSESEINCLAGNFTLVDGIMNPEAFMLDTSQIRVEGKGEVNFKTDAIDFHLKPTSKSSHFFTAATPISITGTIAAPDIGVTTADVVGTIFRMTTSIVTTPFKKIFLEELEPDGKIACDAAMAWVKDVRNK